MGNERFDISTPKEYLTKDKARLLYVSSATYGGDWISTPHCMLTAKMTFFYTKNDIYILRGIFFCKSHAKYLLKYKLLSFKHNFKYS